MNQSLLLQYKSAALADIVLLQELRALEEEAADRRNREQDQKKDCKHDDTGSGECRNSQTQTIALRHQHREAEHYRAGYGEVKPCAAGKAEQQTEQQHAE